ncbi:MAG: hypothetical protein N3B13_02175 [Deltaproteobacteria bacterium]|nr:hypothetical protein [Deltaproteobacteria bacterium]
MEKRTSGLVASLVITAVIMGLTAFLFFFLSSPESRGTNFYVAFGYLLFLELISGLYLSLVYTARSELRTKGMWDFFFILGMIISSYAIIGFLTVIVFALFNIIVATSRVLITVVVIETAFFIITGALAYFIKARSSSFE